LPRARASAAKTRTRESPSANALWDLALIGNRGVGQDRILGILLGSIHDENVNI
jgi:hypothetical protein